MWLSENGSLKEGSKFFLQYKQFTAPLKILLNKKIVRLTVYLIVFMWQVLDV